MKQTLRSGESAARTRRRPSSQQTSRAVGFAGALTLGIAALAFLITGCAHAGLTELPGPVPSSPATEATGLPTPPVQPVEAPKLPENWRERAAELTLADVVTIALENNPATRASWFAARSAAAQLGSKKALYWPAVDLSATAIRAEGSATGMSSTEGVTVYGPAASLEVLLFDFNRGPQVEEARQTLLAADWSHNAVVQSVVLATVEAYYSYVNVKGQREAAAVAVKEAKVALEAAETRKEVGLATRADVLQAQTAVSRAELVYEALDGQRAVVRGALATTLGLPATTPLDVGPLPADVPLDSVAAEVEGLINEALTGRPDLAALRTEAAKANVHIATVRGEGLPSISLSGTVGRSYFSPRGDPRFTDDWSAGLYVRFPLFTGFANSYDIERARSDAAAAMVQATGLEQQVALEVWSAYYDLQTAAQRVRTSRDLLAFATESEDVALARYREGVGSLLDLLTAQAALADARAQVILARTDLFTSLARLGHATGKLGPLQVREIVPSGPVVAPAGENPTRDEEP